MTPKDKQALYKEVFGSPAGQEVLADLNIFCNGTSFHNTDDPMKLMRLEGRREVLIEIVKMLKLKNLEVFFEDYIDPEL